MGSKKSSSNSTTQQSFYDQRSITTIDDRDTTQNYSYRGGDTYTDSRDQSLDLYALDSSNRSTNYTSISTADPGAVKLGELNAQLLGAVAETQSDALKTVAGLGAGAFRDVAGNLGQITGASERAWSHTIDAAGSLLEQTIATSKASTDAAKSLAQSAIASYQPADNKTADAFKYAAIAAAAIAALYAFRRA